jgi:hypothetical protein
MPPTAKPTAGSPTAAASTPTSPNGSGQQVGRAHQRPDLVSGPLSDRTDGDIRVHGGPGERRPVRILTHDGRVYRAVQSRLHQWQRVDEQIHPLQVGEPPGEQQPAFVAPGDRCAGARRDRHARGGHRDPGGLDAVPDALARHVLGRDQDRGV